MWHGALSLWSIASDTLIRSESLYGGSERADGVAHTWGCAAQGHAEVLAWMTSCLDSLNTILGVRYAYRGLRGSLYRC